MGCLKSDAQPNMTTVSSRDLVLLASVRPTSATTLTRVLQAIRPSPPFNGVNYQCFYAILWTNFKKVINVIN